LILLFRRKQVDFSDSGALLQAAQSARVRLNPPSVVLLNDEDVSGLIRQDDGIPSAVQGRNKPHDMRLRTPEVSRSTVPVANHPEIRAVLVEQQRAMALACRSASPIVLPSEKLSSFHTLS
jgi:cytidylate kinase